MRNQPKYKAIVLMIFALCLAGLLCTWLRKSGTVKAARTSAGANRHQVRPNHSTSNASSFDREPKEADNPFTNQAALAGSDYLTGHETAAEPSRTFAELVQEIRAQNPENKEADLFLPIANLATGHPNAEVREQGVAYLAQSEDERAVVFLITALLDTEFHIRQLSLNALTQSRKRVPVQPLIEFALNAAGAMRAQAVDLIRQVAGAGSDEVRQLEAQLQEVSANE